MTPQTEVGKLIGKYHERDAIYIAIAPVTAAQHLSPGQRIRLDAKDSSMARAAGDAEYSAIRRNRSAVPGLGANSLAIAIPTLILSFLPRSLVIGVLQIMAGVLLGLAGYYLGRMENKLRRHNRDTCLRCGGPRDYQIDGVLQDQCYECARRRL